MSFSKAPRTVNGGNKNNNNLSPAAPPPAAPPPPAPHNDDSETESVVTVDEDTSNRRGRRQGGTSKAAAKPKPQHYSYLPDTHYPTSYQSIGFSGARAAAIPTITHFGDNNNNNNNDDSSSTTASNNAEVPSFVIRGGGDASIRPNTGQTNDDFGGIGSLTEVVASLRWATIFSCATAVLWEGFALPTRLLIHAWIYPAKVILGCYLGVFSLLLLGVELNLPFRDNFGVLYHPLGRGGLLWLMSGMCFGILASWWEILLGVAFAACGGMYWWTYWKYPEYRTWQSYQDNHVWDDLRSVVDNRSSLTSAWANPYASDTRHGGYQGTEEERALLSKV
jgi:hypothetical protein